MAKVRRCCERRGVRSVACGATGENKTHENEDAGHNFGVSFDAGETEERNPDDEDHGEGDVDVQARFGGDVGSRCTSGDDGRCYIVEESKSCSEDSDVFNGRSVEAESARRSASTARDSAKGTGRTYR
jgi:hypothetical protein